MTTKIQLRLDAARTLAETLVARLRPDCSRIEIAGSIRRENPVVGDIELVVIPTRPADLWGDRDDDAPTALDQRLQSMYEQGTFTARPKNGTRYKQFELYGEIQLDLFITTPECWGINFAIRTGPADYSRAIVTPRERGGLLQNGYHVRDARLWINQCDVPVETPEEEDFFEFVHGGWIEPNAR